MIDMIKVSKRYPPNVTALTDVSLSVPKGELLFLTGMSGAGKTTLLKLIANMERPTSGLVEVSGRNIHKLKGKKLALQRRKIGMAYQDFKLLTEQTVAQNIAIAMEVAYRSPQNIRVAVRDLLGQLDLSDKHNSLTGDLSRGEQQRVALARAVANDPELLLIDEPTGNLDTTTTVRVMDLLRRHHLAGATLIIATHDQSIYQGSQHRTLEMTKGHLSILHEGARA
ncbi:MAG: cell division ATP-binding protein FtsE [Desulfobulbaceae bacterium]|uniref:Cell division ATP-binding protein FtsE n=1 Tax=Candidatus Desulfatifera sulfidica TaxID=2841691 RepID=A0A8J6N7Y9_9BACT|nr:cell division ATP-binding protein FtsE [Candidatus Desulfatifera sulfidica]